MSSHNAYFTDYTLISGDEAKRLRKVSEKIQNGETDVIILGQEDDESRRKEPEPIRLVDYIGGKEYTQQYVGVIWDEAKGETILLRSRFDGEDGFFTNYVLSRALGVSGAYFPDMRPQLAQNQMAEWLLALVFMGQIRDAQRQGLYRAYRNDERNDSSPRGRIDIARHIRQNPLLSNGKIAYTVRERSLDNPVNRVIVAAYSALEKKHRSLMRTLENNNRAAKEAIDRLKRDVSVPSRQELTGLLRRRAEKINSPLYKQWETVRRTAEMILRHTTPEVAKGSAFEMGGVLVDMNTMWELYLEAVLRKMVPEGQMLSAQEKYYILLPGVEKPGKRTCEPDFWWKRGDDTVLIADAKYKNSWSKIANKATKEKDLNEAWQDVRADVFQVLSYMYTTGCSQGVIICPVSGDLREENIFNVSAQRKDDKFHVIGLPIPQAYNDYDDFQEKMKDFEDTHVKKIKECLKSAQ